MTGDDDNALPTPTRPKRANTSEPFTHQTSAYRRVGKKWGIYKEVGVARAEPCAHCGSPYSGTVKVFVDRLIAYGGATGGFLLKPNGVLPPRIEKDFPEQAEFDEKEILPES